MAKPRGTDGSLLASLPWTLSALLISLAPHVPFLPVWITGAFLGCAAWRYIIERQRRTLPSSWVRAGLALSCFLGVLWTYSSISGVGPGSALLAVMAALKLLETRQRRDQFVLLFLSIFLVMSSLLREQYLWSVPYMVVSVLVIMTAWLRMSANEHQAARESFVTGARLLAYAVPLAAVMWVFFPRIATPFWSVPIDTGTAISGLSDSISPGDISALSKSDAVAFRVNFESAVPEPRDRYWRGLVLHRFDDLFATMAGVDAPQTRGAVEDRVVPDEDVVGDRDALLALEEDGIADARAGAERPAGVRVAPELVEGRLIAVQVHGQERTEGAVATDDEARRQAYSRRIASASGTDETWGFLQMLRAQSEIQVFEDRLQLN